MPLSPSPRPVPTCGTQPCTTDNVCTQGCTHTCPIQSNTNTDHTRASAYTCYMHMYHTKAVCMQVYIYTQVYKHTHKYMQPHTAPLQTCRLSWPRLQAHRVQRPGGQAWPQLPENLLCSRYPWNRHPLSRKAPSRPCLPPNQCRHLLKWKSATMKGCWGFCLPILASN